MNRTRLLSFAICIALLVASFSAHAQDVPTLTPPTLVPQPPAADIDALPSESGIAQIIRTGIVRVGILFNEPPFGELNVRGEVSGFDADLARALAEAWGVQVQFVQVTRQTAVATLNAGQVDMLLAAQVNTRTAGTLVEFSQTYYPTMQAMLVRELDGAAGLGDMQGRRVGFVLGTRAADAVAYWQQRSGIQITMQTYLTLDQAIVALVNSEVDGIVANRIRLERAVTTPGIAKILPDAVMPEPYAIAVRRQDVNLRNLINKTLQYLEGTGRLNEIHRANFNGVAYPNSSFIRWANIGEEAPKPDQFGQDIPFPTQYTIPRMQGDASLRVAGLTEIPADAPESVRRLDAANRALVAALAGRWGVSISYVSGNPLELLAAGQADLAIPAAADWNASGQVDFVAPYLLRGERLLVPSASQIGGFGGLRSGIVGVFADEPAAAQRVTDLAERERAIVRNTFSILREQDAVFGMLVDNNYNAVFGDSLKLIPFVQTQPNDVRLVADANGNPVWYSRQLLSLATPRNDIDFRLLVEYTLQEMSLDGMLAQALAEVTLPNEQPAREIVPGAAEYLGYNLRFSG
jgi:ABC-type amino acid transport substrate-binding protein